MAFYKLCTVRLRKITFLPRPTVERTPNVQDAGRNGNENPARNLGWDCDDVGIRQPLGKPKQPLQNPKIRENYWLEYFA